MEYTNEQLAEMIRDGSGDGTALLEKLFNQNSGFVTVWARRYARTAEDAEDLRQDAFIALVDAVKSYDTEKGSEKGTASFLTWWAVWMRKHFMEQHGAVYIPRYRIQQVREYRRAWSDLMARTGREPSVYELAAALQIPTDEVEEIARTAATVAISLDTPLTDDSGSLTVAGTLESGEDVAESVTVSVYREELRRALDASINELPRQQANVIRWRWFDGETAAETERRHGVSQANVYTLNRKGLRALRRSRRLRGFIYADAVHGVSLRSFRETGTSATEKIALRLIEA